VREVSGPGEPPGGEVHAEAPDRLVFFSDAVAAIALTLLALELPVPHVPAGWHGSTERALWHDLGDHWHSDFLPFLLSFVVIAAFWNAHRELFRHVDRIDRGGLVPVNFVFLLMIVLLPFVTRVIGADGDHQIGVVLYAVTIVLTALALAVEAVIIRRYQLHHAGTEQQLRGFTAGMLALALIFAASIPFGFLAPAFTTWLWLILAIAFRFVGRLLRHLGVGGPRKADHHPKT
jgi:TMEM175 potassium channel family protein